MTTQAPSRSLRRTRSTTVGSRVADFVRSLPDRVALICLAVFLVASVTSTLNVFYEWAVLPAAVIAAIGFCLLTPRQQIVPNRAVLYGSLASIVIAVVFVLGNLHFTSQSIVPTGDPGLYTLGGIWLSQSPTAGIDISGAHGAVTGIPGVSAQLGAFVPSPDGIVNLQGGDLLPTMIAIGTWLGGIRLGLSTNLVLGGAALITVYGLARRVLGPIWALVPQLALGLSVAFLFFARGSYSEIIMVTVCAAGLTYLLSAVRSGSTRDFVVAGMFLGTASMARIDGPLAFIGSTVVLGVAGLGFVTGDRRRQLGRGLLWFFVVTIVTTVVGLLGIALNKTVYINTLLPQARLLWAVGIGVCVVTGLLWFIGRNLPPGSFIRTWRVASYALASGTALILIFWMSRPLWYVSRQGSLFQQPTVGALQKLEGLPVDPARSYEEHTMSWIAWYFGWPTLSLAVVGFVLLVFLGVKRRSIPLLLLAAAPLAVAALYFTRVSITPSQIWAFRRLLPIVTPGFLIAAVFALRVLWGAVRGRGAARVVFRSVAVLLAAVVALTPLVAWNGILAIRDGSHQADEIQAICTGIAEANPGAKSVVLIRDGAPANYALTLRTVCDLQVASVSLSTIDSTSLETVHEKLGDVAVVTYRPDLLPNGDAAAFRGASPTATVTVPFWGRGLLHLPNTFTQSTRSVWLGELRSNGAIVPAT